MSGSGTILKKLTPSKKQATTELEKTSAKNQDVPYKPILHIDTDTDNTTTLIPVPPTPADKKITPQVADFFALVREMAASIGTYEYQTSTPWPSRPADFDYREPTQRKRK